MCNCTYSKKNDRKESIATNDSVVVANGFILQQEKDSIRADLIVKINNDSTYIPIIDYIVDNIVFTFLDSTNVCHFDEESFFRNPLDYLSKTKVNNKILVTAEFTVRRLLFYFLLDVDYKIIDCIEFSTHRESIVSRKIYNWSNDGEQDIVETRQYHGQMYSSITEVVYSVTDHAFKRIFSLEVQKLNCVTTDDNNNGIVLHREYKQIKPDVFQISEIEGYVNCENADIPNNAKPFKIINRRKYEITIQELLNEYGKQYDR